MIRLRVPIALSAALAVTLGAGGALSGAATTKTISVKDNVFSPKNATIAKGTRVTWKWTGSNPHNVKSRGTKKFKSSSIKSSGTHKVTFTKTGTYSYVCTIHEDDGMKGKIVVR